MLRGDAAHLPLPDASVDLICTSPPYWALRSYSDNGEHYDGQIGSEATPAEYVASLLDCTREWVRVLKPSGSLFVDLGDKFSDRGHGPSRGNGTGRGPQATLLSQTRGPMEKSLLGLPWRYALACMDDLGLILRRDIIWSKPNGLPESVTDRCRSSHEYVFHFTVRPRYYAAVDEIREPHTSDPDAHRPGRNSMQARNVSLPRSSTGALRERDPLGKLPGSVWDIPSQPLTVPAHLGVDHFAAFPMELPRRCILGWSPPGICVECGEGARAVTDEVGWVRGKSDPVRDTPSRYRSPLGRQNGNKEGKLRQITGYACSCPEPFTTMRPAVVLDPFGGTGTTALVAAAYGRVGVSVDRSADYCRLARWRTADPAERAKAMMVAKPPPVPDRQGSLFDLDEPA